MGAPTIGPPTLAGFQYFLVNFAGFNIQVLPPASPVIGFAFGTALLVVNTDISAAGQLLYNNAVYNLATDYVVNYAQDQQGQDFFACQRTQYKVNAFAPGVVQSASDVSTATSLQVIEAAKNFTLADLQNLKTPWGRRYLAIAQQFGPTPYGIT